jgi:hypothetical protein
MAIAGLLCSARRPSVVQYDGAAGILWWRGAGDATRPRAVAPPPLAKVAVLPA